MIDTCGCDITGTTVTWCAYHRRSGLEACRRIREANGWANPHATSTRPEPWLTVADSPP